MVVNEKEMNRERIEKVHNETKSRMRMIKGNKERERKREEKSFWIAREFKTEMSKRKRRIG